jgi:hypothetical protein
VDDLVSPHTQDRCAEELLALGIHQYFHEALRLTLLEGAADISHCHLGDQHSFACLAYLGFSHADAAQWRIGVEVVGGDAIADATRVVVEKIGRDDLEVVVGRVRKGASGVTVPERPDAGHAGTQLVVDLDIAELVARHACLFQTQIFGVRAPADGHQQMRADDLLDAVSRVRGYDDVVGTFGDLQLLDAQMQRDVFLAEDVGDRC